MKKVFALLSIALVSLLGTNLASTDSSAQELKFRRSVESVPGRYIVVLNDKAYGDLEFTNRAESASYELAGAYGGNVDKVFNAALYGFSTEMSEDDAKELSRDSRVLFVEEDAIVRGSAIQSNPTWGLDRIDQRTYPLNASYQYTSTGSNVNVYVIDSGIRTTHQDFGGRAFNTMDFVGDGQNGNDCLGHGTHVAGTIGSSTYGVAKNVRLHSLRVLACDGSGMVSGIVAAINWVTANRVGPAVANISVTASSVSASMNTAVANSIASGVTYTVASGNFSGDACNYSPGSSPDAITVGSTVVMNASVDYRMSYSNQGPCVDIFAPGNGIVSVSNADDVSSRMMNGTSMAAPHVAGVAALYLENNPTASPATVAQEIVNGATAGTVTNIAANSPNKQLYAWIGGVTPPTLPAQVTIIKQVTNAQGGNASNTPFGFAASNLGTSGFTLIDNNAPPADRYINSNIIMFESGSDIVVTESATSGWELNSIQCVETSGSGLPNLQNSTVELTTRRATIRIEEGEQVTCTFASQELAPTASSVMLSGRIVDSRGRGVKNIQIFAENMITGDRLAATTNSFGYYTFYNVLTTQLYSVMAKSRRYEFSPESRSIVLEDSISDLDFTAALR